MKSVIKCAWCDSLVVFCSECGKKVEGEEIYCKKCDHKVQDTKFELGLKVSGHILLLAKLVFGGMASIVVVYLLLANYFNW